MEIWETPAYTPATAARLIGLRPERIRRWLHGYRFTYSIQPNGEEIISEKSSVIRSKGEDKQRYASFIELIDLLFVKKFIDHGIPLQKLRKALSEAETLLGEKHFANKRFFTDGSGIYLQLQGNLRNQKAESLLRLLSGGQWVIPEIILQTSEQIDFDTVSEHAIRWYPVPGDRRIVLDPRISFGAPIIARRGIKTINIYDLYLAENNNINAVSDWMEIEKDEVLSAIEFEMKLAA